MEGLEARERGIAANIEEAKRSAEMAAAQLRQYEAKLAAATEESREILNQARKDAEAAREQDLVGGPIDRSARTSTSHRRYSNRKECRLAGNDAEERRLGRFDGGSARSSTTESRRSLATDP